MNIEGGVTNLKSGAINTGIMTLKQQSLSITADIMEHFNLF